MKVLCVCDCNLNRSPTLEDYLKHCYPKAVVKSAGIMLMLLAGFECTYLDKSLALWADRIYVMENRQKEYIIKNYQIKKDIIFKLDIPDIYNRNDLELIKVFERRKNLGVFEGIED